jgi:chromosome segregation ATPase
LTIALFHPLIVFMLEPKYFFKAFFFKKKTTEQAPTAIEETNPLFKIGDFVQTIADTTPGIDSRDSVSICGHIVDLQASLSENSWKYYVKSIHDERNRRRTPEARIRLVSVTLNDNCILPDTCGVKRRLEEERARNQKLKENYAELKSDLPVLEGEIKRLRCVNTKLKDKNEDLVARSSELAFELRESTPSSIFSTTEPTGRNAREIKARIKTSVTPMQIEIGGLKCEVEESRKLSRKLSGELRVLNTKNTELKRESKSARLQIKQLSNLVEDFNHEHEKKESAIKAEARVEEDIQIIKAMLTGVSSRQAEALQLNRKKDIH